MIKALKGKPLWNCVTLIPALPYTSKAGWRARSKEPCLSDNSCQCENLSQDFPVTPLLQPPMGDFAIRRTQGQQVPLRTGVQYPEHRCQDDPRRTGVRPWRLSGLCSSGTYSRIRSHWPSRRRSLMVVIRMGIHVVNHFENRSKAINPLTSRCMISAVRQNPSPALVPYSVAPNSCLVEMEPGFTIKNLSR